MASVPIVRQVSEASGFPWQIADFCERIAAAALLTAASPLIAASAAAIAISSRRSPFIAHRRVGWKGQALWMLKLRTMWGDEPAGRQPGAHWVEHIEDDSGSESKNPGDPRVPNSFARFCRRHSIDELPQLWHVIRGEMSLVGPRPVTARELTKYYGADAEEILKVKPGIAGLWQISGRNRLTYSERRKLDLEFVRSRSLSMCIRILLRTIPEVLSGMNSW